MAYTLSMLCGEGVASATLQYTYSGMTYARSGANISVTFDEGTTVRLTAISFDSGYQYPATVTNLNTFGTYTMPSSPTWTYNSSVGGAPHPSGYMLEATAGVTPPSTTGYLTLYFNANGGSGGPASAGPFQVTNNVAVVQIPATAPTRSGYAFLGWSTSSSATAPSYYSGAIYSNWWASAGNSTQTLYAVWLKQTSTGKARIGNGYGFDSYTPYIWNNGWKKAVPHVWNNGWKKGV